MPGTDGHRIYAIGDIHGCRYELGQILRRVGTDLAARPHARPVIVCVGDYCDRGPDTRGVLDDLIALAQGPVATVFLRGNHDQWFIDYLRDPHDRPFPDMHWLHPSLGGLGTLNAYGVRRLDVADPEATHAAFNAAVPRGHRDFLNATRPSFVAGDYLFVHAGIRPGIPLDRQDPEDLMFIRREFLDHPGPHDHIVVHGHTPVRQIEHHGVRIAIDTGAVFGRHLTCLIVEDTGVWDLTETGPVAVEPGPGTGAT